MMFFDRFDPSDTDPRYHVDRDHDRHWLREVLRRYLDLDGEPIARPICLTGVKGVGKSILTRAVLESLRADFSGNTLFVSVDCRSCHSRRSVLAALAAETVRELDCLTRAGTALPKGLFESARLLQTVTTLDQCELQVAHERTRQFRAALGLSGARQLLSALQLNFGLTLEAEEKHVRNLVGSIKFDDRGVTDSFIALLRDVRAQGLNVLIYLDNIDELNHDYRLREMREQIRRDVEGVLALCRAPVALILSMRQYYTGVVPREISHTRVIRPLSADLLVEVLDRRTRDEVAELRAAIHAPALLPLLTRLAGAAPTALAFLRWVKFLFEEGMLTPNRLDEGFDAFLESYYANLDRQLLERVAAAFREPREPLAAEDIRAACGGNDAVFEQLQDRQVILPRDFWNPTQFTLDPELDFLHPSRQLR